jgi:pimeloyl-ACP methyl ester carboxylesterase
VSHLQKDWQNLRFRAFFEALGKRFTVTRYDRTGVGLSDRDRERFTIEEEVAELSAVVDAVDTGPVCILAMSCGGPTAIHYAAEHPERARALVFFGSYLEGFDLGPDATRDAMQGLVRACWGLGSRTIADMMAPELQNDQLEELSRNHQRAASPETAARLLGLSYAMSSRAKAPLVSAPALVAHRQNDRTVRFERGVELAGALGNATLLSFPGTAHVMWEGDHREVVSAVSEFLGNALGREAWSATDAEPSAEGSDATDGPKMHRRGDLWEIRYAGQSAHVAQSKGMADLAVLLANPGSDVRALDLMTHFSAEEVGDPSNDAVLDERARAELAERIAMLDAELDKAESDADLGRVALLRRERDFIVAELERNVAAIRRARRFTGPAERARKAVSARIRAAIDKIREVHAPLAAHLDASLQTGLSCRYSPDPPRSWSVSG